MTGEQVPKDSAGRDDVVALVVVVAIAFFVRVYFAYSQVFVDGAVRF